MEQINRHRYELTTRDFLILGELIEMSLEKIIDLEYGYYKLDNDDFSLKMALKIIEGMENWQDKHNKGVKLVGEYNNSLHIYDKKGRQEKMDEAMLKFEI